MLSYRSGGSFCKGVWFVGFGSAWEALGFVHSGWCSLGGVGYRTGAGGAWLVYLGNAYRGFAVLIELSAFRGMVCHSVFYWLLVGNGMVGRWWVTDLLRFFARYMIERRHALRRNGRTEEFYKGN